MTPLPITLCLYTSTKGHFGQFDLYKRTVTDLFNQVPANTFGGRGAHIKESVTRKLGEPNAKEMAEWLSQRNVCPSVTTEDWSHGAQHQSGYLKDMKTLTASVGTEYLLHMEDDFLLRTKSYNVIHWLARAITLLDDPDVIQVRIARWANERERINGLRAKHGIDSRTEDGDNPDHFRATDWSNNPFIVRTRDMQIALLLMERNPHAFPAHAEHGIAAAMKYLSRSAVPIAVFDPSLIYCRHIGTLPNENDPLDQPLIAR